MALAEIADLIFTIAAAEVNLILIIVGIYLLVNGTKKQMNNLKILGIAFLLVGLSVFALVAFGLTLSQITIPTYLGIALYGPFIYMTFHREKEDSKAKLMVALIFVFFLLKAYFGTFENQSTLYFNLSQISTILVTATPAAWLGYSATDAYSKLKDVDVEPYLRKRLWIMGFVSYVYAIGVTVARVLVITFQTNTQSGTNLTGAVISILIAFYLSVFAIGMLLVWVMPNFFKNFLNRGYQSQQEVQVEIDNKDSIENLITEEIKTQQEKADIQDKSFDDFKEELKQLVKIGYDVKTDIDMFTYLGQALSQKTGRMLIVCKGIFRHVVLDEFGELRPNIDLSQWIQALTNHLPDRLSKIRVDNSEEISREIIDELLKNQSIITITAI